MEKTKLPKHTNDVLTPFSDKQQTDKKTHQTSIHSRFFSLFQICTIRVMYFLKVISQFIISISGFLFLSHGSQLHFYF